MPFRIHGDARAASRDEALADYRVVTPAFFETLRVPVRRGRVFTERDTSESPFVYVINESFARTYFSGRDPLREKISVRGDFLPFGEIAGVVEDVNIADWKLGRSRPSTFRIYNTRLSRL